jgi:hypothetical protein
LIHSKPSGRTPIITQVVIGEEGREDAYQRIRDENRNMLLNRRFEVTSRGSSFAAVTSGQRLFDNWWLEFDGTPTIAVTRERVDAGQDHTPYGPRYAMRIDVTGVGAGMTTFALCTGIENLRQFGDRTLSFGAWLKSSVALSVSARLAATYGTGGGPSGAEVFTPVTEDASAKAVATTWPDQPLRWCFSLPSQAGKVFGTNDDDWMKSTLALPLNATFTIWVLEPSLEFGEAVSPPVKYDAALEAARCSGRVFRVPDPGTILGGGDVFSVNVVHLEVPLPPEMRRPGGSITLEAIGGAVAANFAIQAVDGTGGVVCTSMPTLVSVDGGKAILAFTSTAHGKVVRARVTTTNASFGLVIKREYP